MLISTITSNISFIQLSLMHRITEKICKERWQHWCTKISGVKVLPTLLISTITSNMSFIRLSLMLSGYPASSWGNLFMMSIPPSIFFFDVLPSHFNPCRIFSSLHSIIPFPVGIVVAPCMVDIIVIRPAFSSTVPLYHRDFSSFVP